MSRSGWKRAERRAAALIGGQRHPANTGGRVDCESERIVAQVKECRALSLARLTALAVEMEAVGWQRGKLGVVIVKHSAGRGRATPYLVACTEGVWRALHPVAFLPADGGAA